MVAVVNLVAELVFDYLVSDMQNFHVQDPVVVLTIVLVPEHADLLLIPTVARRGGIALSGHAYGICSDHGAGAGSTRRSACCRTCGGTRRIRGGICRTRGACSIRRSRCRTCSGVRRSRGARAGGTRCACGCSRGIVRARCRTCDGTRRIRGGICRTRGARACGVRRSRSAGSIRRTRCRICGGTRRICRFRGGARRVRGACAGGTRSSARCRTCSGVRRSRGARGGSVTTCTLICISVISVGRFGGCAHRYQVAIVAEGHLLLAQATTFLLFGEGHGYHGQHAKQHHRSHHAKYRHITAH